MKYVFLIIMINIVVNISFKIAKAATFLPTIVSSSNFLAYFGYVGFIFSFYLYAKVSKTIHVSILFPLIQGGSIAFTILAEYILFATQVSLLSVFGITSILLGIFLLSPEKNIE